MVDGMPAMTKPIDEFEREMATIGLSTFVAALPPAQVAGMRADCLKWVNRCRTYQIAAGINADGDGTAHHSVGDDDALDAYLHQHLFHPYLSQYFGGKPYIMHACNPVGGLPGQRTYVHGIHRDARTYIPGYRLRINMLVMLDEFTPKNGATKILLGSQTMREVPDENEFERRCHPITGPAGSVVLFDSYLWHRGGINSTDRARVAHSLCFGPAFIKPQMDYARMLGEERAVQFSELSRQVLGYNSRVPMRLEEWYRPRDSRLYQADQG